ncbi:MFS transporter [Rathayibacter tanaceti]|uniref:MFS transporter n=2 Tax=Rathayibacter tanaceti TaxID=1671680 RepID=A0A162F852_9MICO|nr:MFS transporter [Rathayibacter tanaceti]KZX20323.1 Purine ribonucleoside efflux pump NepI [Rathayibacter tanaceti]QHC56708.1 MFS transporter [Rathayibacter tanaceti]TCO32999.1 putative MFS family arabinose efflux permease [Rathayibacter tanaceti]
MNPQDTSKAPSFPWIGLLTLAGAVFVSVTSEFLPTGLIPDMSRDLGVSISLTGQLVTIFAATVVVATTPLTLVTQRVSRKSLVLVALCTIALANVLAALAPTFGLLVGARILGGLAHGLFWAVVSAYSAHLVAPEYLGRATAITAGGGSAAFVLGVPLGTALGHAFGWRPTFAILGGIVLVLALLVVRFLPAVDHHIPLRTGEIRLPARKDRTLPRIIGVCVVILLVLIGQNTLSTYITPWLENASFAPDSVPLVLFAFGGAGAVGLVLAGFASDRFPRSGFVVAAIAVVLALAGLAVAAGSEATAAIVLAAVVWNIAFGGIPAMLQTRMLRTSSFRLRNLAAALQTTAFNIGIGGGAIVGGLAIDANGLEVLPWVAIVIVALGLVVSLFVDARAAAAGRAEAGGVR